MNIFSNINSNEFTISAFIIGYLLCENLNMNEQNAIGNWLMLVGQVLETNSAQIQVLQNNNQTIDINNLKKAIEIINQKLKNI